MLILLRPSVNATSDAVSVGLQSLLLHRRSHDKMQNELTERTLSVMPYEPHGFTLRAHDISFRAPGRCSILVFVFCKTRKSSIGNICSQHPAAAYYRRQINFKILFSTRIKRKQNISVFVISFWFPF